MKGCLREFHEVLYLAFYKHNKQIIAFATDKKKLELYLFKTELYDKASIIESDDKQFIDAVYFEYWSYRLVTHDYNEQCFVCTEREYVLLCKYIHESSTRIQDIIDNIRYLVTVLDLDEKEMNKLYKAAKLLSNINYGHNNDSKLIPKGCLDNKTLRRLRDMEDELTGLPEDVESFYKRYDIIIID